MATKFLEPGGDATFNVALTSAGGFWTGTGISPPVLGTDFVHGGHVKSIKYNTGANSRCDTANTILSNTGSRISIYFYINALPSATANLFRTVSIDGPQVVHVRITSAGVLQIWDNTTAQIGTDGSTLSTGQWYRISLAFTITDTTHNRFELFKDGVSDISITNATITNIFNTTGTLGIGNSSANANFDLRSSDHYVDDSASLADTGDIWVTAKRPNANGTTNGFTTQIGSGGSGYGTGHSPQVNERALSTTNGWSMVGAGSAVTEEYNIESTSTGDIDISGHIQLIDYVGWVYASALVSETGQIIVNNVTSNVSLTSANTMFTAVAGSNSYPAGSGTDIGLITSTTVTTVSLYECGILVAYIPTPTPTGDVLLEEDSNYILQESGYVILLDASGNPVFLPRRMRMGVG